MPSLERTSCGKVLSPNICFIFVKLQITTVDKIKRETIRIVGEKMEHTIQEKTDKRNAKDTSDRFKRHGR